MSINPVFFARPLVAHLGWTLLHFLWQGVLIAALYSVVRSLARRWMSTHALYSLACLCLAIMAMAPILTYGFLASDHWGSAIPVGSIPQTQVTSNGKWSLHRLGIRSDWITCSAPSRG